eukprot:scaffold4737_cov92-Cylindrotheca_fusiformis.AAC.5
MIFPRRQERSTRSTKKGRPRGPVASNDETKAAGVMGMMKEVWQWLSSESPNTEKQRKNRERGC